MIEGSTLRLRSTSLPPEIDRSESLRAATLASVSGWALVTSALVTPRKASLSLTLRGRHGLKPLTRHGDLHSLKLVMQF